MYVSMSVCAFAVKTIWLAIRCDVAIQFIVDIIIIGYRQMRYHDKLLSSCVTESIDILL